MKKLALIALVVAVVGLFAADGLAQQRGPLFATAVTARTIQPGATLGITGTIADASKVNLASRECYFLVGLLYNPRQWRMPFVLPPILIGKAQFKAVVQRGQPTKLLAGMRFPMPKVKLPRGFKLPLYFQAVALGKDRQNGIVPIPAQAAMTVLVP
jgi:hypothetical protein